MSQPSSIDVLILTARFDADLFAELDALRRRHFPPALNKIPAHLTLFHHLPGTALETIEADLTAACAGTPAIDVTLPSLRFLGKGTAANVEAVGLVPRRDRLATGWESRLKPQDRQKFSPHVTIQNKVEPSKARANYERLNRGWHTLAGRIDGLLLWEYLGGPWRLVRAFDFTR